MPYLIAVASLNLEFIPASQLGCLKYVCPDEFRILRIFNNAQIWMNDHSQWWIKEIHIQEPLAYSTVILCEEIRNNTQKQYVEI